MSIIIQNLTKIFGKQKAVSNISFQAAPGQILGFLGPNGAGKSTTMKIAACYLPPTEGKITVCGYDVEIESMQVRKLIGYLPEHNPLYLDMYVHEYLRFAGSIFNLKGNSLATRVKDMVELCGLTLEQNKKIGALSKGYRQRVGLAQALIHDPEVLILDEPTTGLDPNQILEIRKLIKAVSANKTIIFSTHIMQEVQALCDKVIIINHGEIIADSDVDTLKKLSQSQVLTAAFSEQIDPEIIINLPGVIDVTAIGSNRYKIHSSPGFDVRADIFRLATENNWKLIELKVEETSLETIFQQLTQKQDILNA